MYYVNAGNFDRFVARDKENKNVFYRVSQGGVKGDTRDYVRVDESLNVTIHEVAKMFADGTFSYNQKPLSFNITWT